MKFVLVANFVHKLQFIKCTIVMAVMAVILCGLATSNEGDAYGLLFTASPRGLFLINLEFTIYGILSGENLAGCLVGWKTPSTIMSQPGFEHQTSRTAWPWVRKSHALMH